MTHTLLYIYINQFHWVNLEPHILAVRSSFNWPQFPLLKRLLHSLRSPKMHIWEHVSSFVWRMAIDLVRSPIFAIAAAFHNNQKEPSTHTHKHSLTSGGHVAFVFNQSICEHWVQCAYAMRNKWVLCVVREKCGYVTELVVWTPDTGLIIWIYNYFFCIKCEITQWHITMYNLEYSSSINTLYQNAMLNIPVANTFHLQSSSNDLFGSVLHKMFIDKHNG